MSDYITIDITRHKSDPNSKRKVKINIEIVPETSSLPAQKSASKSKELFSDVSPTAAFP